MMRASSESLHSTYSVIVAHVRVQGGGGFDDRPPAPSTIAFLLSNGPKGMVFILQHSLLSIRNIERWFRMSYGVARLLYNVISAATLHLFLHTFTPLQTPVVFVMPVPVAVRCVCGLGCLAVAFVCFLSQGSTWALLVTTSLLQTLVL